VGDLLSTSRGDFYVECLGQERAEPMVFVAGLGDDHSSWSEIVAILSDAYRCISFDNRGIGQSQITPGPYSAKELARDTHEIVQALDLGPTIAVGSSMGGAICQEWALAYPEDLSHLVLTNTWAERDAFLTVLFEHWIDLADQGAARDLLRSLLLFCYSPDFLAEHPDVIPAFIDGPPPDLAGFAAAAAACRDHHAIDRVGQISLPTLVIGGELDILTRHAFSERLTKRMPNASLTSLKAAHMVFWERPEEFVAAVRHFLGRH
jgi:3-oxoadipate enol-lactonase